MRLSNAANTLLASAVITSSASANPVEVRGEMKAPIKDCPIAPKVFLIDMVKSSVSMSGLKLSIILVPT